MKQYEEMVILMRKMISYFIILFLVFCHITIAVAEPMNVLPLKKRATFSYDDSSETSWTYYQYAEKTLNDGTYIGFLLAGWGDNTEASCFPEFRVFSSTKDNIDIIIQSATIMIDGNMFEITFDELKTGNNHGVHFYFTSDAELFLKSLASAKNLSAVLSYSDGTIPVLFTENEIFPVSQFAYDLLSIDYLNHVADSESAYEYWYREKTPICSYIFNEDLLNEKINEEQSVTQTEEDKWREYSLDEIGVKFFLPISFTVYTRGMNSNDPVVITTGMAPSEIDQILVENNLYLEASQDDFSSEILVTMIGSSLSDFSYLSDSGLLGLSEMWTSSYESYGINILDKDIFSCNNVKYIRMHESQIDADGSSSYRIQYYTTINNQAINFVFVSSNDDVTESEKAFMQEVVERTVFHFDISISSIGSFAQDPDNFTYMVQEDGSACITGYNGLTGTLAIPSIINGYPVTSLTVMERNNFVAHIYIPDSIETIEDNPFKNWKSLKSITVSNNNSSLTTIDGILYSSDHHMLLCYPSKHFGDEYTVPSDVTKIGNEAFYGATSLIKVYLPDGLIEIGDNAFFGLDYVSSISIPRSVEIIGSNPFYGMYSLEEIIVAYENKNFTVQQGALYNRKTDLLIAYPRCYTASSFVFRDGITGIGDNAFWYNNNMLDIQFPDSLTYIGDSAFSGCSNMTFSDLPISLQVIGPAAFMSSSITKVTIPATIQSMGRACFASESLTDVSISPGVTELSAVMFNSSKITHIELPETIKTIGEMAFVNCSDLLSVNIPSSVSEMGDNVFKNCPNVTVSVIKDSYGETYCIKNNVPYQYYTPDL